MLVQALHKALFQDRSTWRWQQANGCGVSCTSTYGSEIYITCEPIKTQWSILNSYLCRQRKSEVCWFYKIQTYLFLQGLSLMTTIFLSSHRSA